MEKRVALFVAREFCINCGSSALHELSSGLFKDEPLRSFIAADPWGENPLPYIADKRWSFVRCNDCGQMFHRNVLSPEWNEIRFSEWMTFEAINKFEAKASTPTRQLHRGVDYVAHALRIEKLTRHIRADGNVRLLDYGCGWGNFLGVCERLGFQAHGVDRSISQAAKGGADCPFDRRIARNAIPCCNAF
jgi:hypothetical protein